MKEEKQTSTVYKMMMVVLMILTILQLDVWTTEKLWTCEVVVTVLPIVLDHYNVMMRIYYDSML